jgi:hypothetical protein
MKSKRIHAPPAMATSLDFFGRLRWIDGRPLLDTIEPYRRELFTKALDTFEPDGRPRFNLVVCGRAKKNWKSADLVLAGLFKLVIPEAPQGNDSFVLANDEGQAADDLALAKKLVACNPILAAELEPLVKEIRRRDGRGSLKILPAHDAIGAHGKTSIFLGFDEIHGYRDYDLLEALAPDPTRTSTTTWICSYDTIYSMPGVPLYDLKQIGFAGTDPRMLFSWYSGDRCTDPAFADLPSELRANPSIGSFADGAAYIEQQRQRLPTHKFRRLHLNLPGAPNGAFLDQGVVMAAVVPGRKVIPYQEGIRYFGFVDMSGGSLDDAVLAISHTDGKRIILDRIEKQAGSPPFDPRQAVQRFAGILHEYHLTSVTGDAYAGLTFRKDFEACGITYIVSKKTATDLYEALEPRLNAGEVELLDVSILIEQAICLVVKGAKIGHQNGDHDDFINAAAGAIDLAARGERRGAIAIGVPTFGSRLRSPYGMTDGFETDSAWLGKR